MDSKNSHKPIMPLILNGLIPVFIGGLIYIVWRDKSLLMFRWFETIHFSGFIAVLRNISVSMPDWFVFSLPGGLWAYSFNYSLIYIWFDADLKIKYAWMFFVPLLSIGLELGKLIGFILGTFDIVDIAFYVFFICLSILAVKMTIRNQINSWRVKNEW